jgi:tRNA modification GTPase
MKFIHQPYSPGDTIAAIATPPGEGGVAIIRIAGDLSLDIASKIFSGPIHSFKTHTAHFGTIFNSQGEHVDDVLILIMLGKRSYCGENTVEIHCHGGGLITRRVLDVVLNAGARAALPGEFTFKAFMNGKLDLAQAEAVQELIGAKNERALDAAENQLKGRLSKKILLFQNSLIQIAAILEAWVDFPEEGLEFTTMDELFLDLETISIQMKELSKTFQEGRIIHDGLAICLIGRPNVGKSSLMNMLLDKERAIVSSIPGTTRDILEDYLRLNGLHIKISDTAGIRDSDEIIEKEGIRRSRKAMEDADLVLLVLDASQNLSSDDLDLLTQVPKEKTLVIWNKIDLPSAPTPYLDFYHTVRISTKERIGLEDLLKAIDIMIWKNGPPSKEEIVITNIRHKESLIQSIESIENVLMGLKDNISPEFLIIDIRHSLSELGKIIGIDITEDVLTAIFSKFCIGK